MLGAGGFLGSDRRSRGSRLEAGTVLLVRIRNTHSASWAEITAWRAGWSLHLNEFVGTGHYLLWLFDSVSDDPGKPSLSA